MSSGSVPVIVSCLKSHAGVADVAHFGCRALAAIAVIHSGQAACLSSGAVPAIVACLKAFGSDAQVTRYGCWALLNIGWSTPSHQAVIISAGAIPLLAAAFYRHTGEAKQKAHEALEWLGYTDEGTKR